MNSPEVPTLSAPEVAPFQPPLTKWQREYQAFQRLLPQLLQTHWGRYVVIHNGEVVDSGANDVNLALHFFAQHGNVPIHVGLVKDQPEPAIRVPRYRPLAGTREPSC